MVPLVRREVPSDIFQAGLVKHCNVNVPIRVTGPIRLDGQTFKKSLNLSRIIFVEHVSMRGCHVLGSLSFTNCVFENGLDLSHAEIDEDFEITGGSEGDLDIRLLTGDEVEAALVLDHAHIHGSLTLKTLTIRGSKDRPCLSGIGAAIDGGCAFRSVDFKPAKPTSGFVAIRIPDLRTSTIKFDLAPGRPFQQAAGGATESRANRVAGDLVAAGIECAGPFEIRKLDAENLDFSMGRFEAVDISYLRAKSVKFSSAATAAVSFLNMKIEEDFDASRIECSGLLSIEGVEARDMTFSMGQFATVVLWNVLAGEISFQHGTCTNLRIWNVFCKGLNFGGVTFKSMLAIQGTHGKRFATERPASAADIDNTYVRGDVELWGVTAKLELKISSARIDGLVWLSMAHIQTIVFCGNPETPLHLGAILVDGAKIDTDCFLQHVEIGDHDVGEFTGKIRFTDCTVGGELSFWQSRQLDNDDYKRNPIGWSDPRARSRISHELRIERCIIGGDLDLTRVIVGDEFFGSLVSRPPGTIILDHTSVTGSLKFRSPESVLCDPHAGDEDSHEARECLVNSPRPPSGKIWAYDAIANFLRMDGLKAENIDLTGLTIRRDPGRPVPPKAGSGPYKDHVQADGVTVRRDFILYVEDGSRSAQIPGALRLVRSKIGKLIVAADTFDDEESDVPEQDGIVLRDASINQLEMPRRSIASFSNGFPVPLDLTDAQIGDWTFGSAARSTQGVGFFNILKEYDLSKSYLDVLDNDRTFSRNVYRSVVKKLRDEGLQNAARRIHYAEHYRAFWEPRRAWTKGSGRLWRPLIASARDSWLALKKLYRLVRERPANKWFQAKAVRDQFSGRRPAQRIFGGLRKVPVPGDAMRRILTIASGHFLRFGASPLPLIFWILILGLMSFFMVSSDSRNFELTLANRQIIASQDRRDEFGELFRTRRASTTSRAFNNLDLARDVRPCDDGEVLGPEPDKWTTLDSVWVTIRYHVPIISVAARDDAVPTDDRGIIIASRPLAELFGLRKPGEGLDPEAFWTQKADGYMNCRTGAANKAADQIAKVPSFTKKMAVSPEDWFQLMAILNWIMWPILITALIRRFVVPED